MSATLPTSLESDGSGDSATGIFTGDVYLHGGGDPTFGTASFDKPLLRARAPPSRSLQQELADTGITQITGRIIGDESRFDCLRGGPNSGFGLNVVDLGGPLSALSFDRGLASPNGGSIQRNPPLFAAQQLTRALKHAARPRHAEKATTGSTPSDAKTLASVRSPSIAQLVRITLKDSDNWFAEMLLKDLAASRGGQGTTTRGASAAIAFARQLGVTRADERRLRPVTRRPGVAAAGGQAARQDPQPR